MMEAHEYANAFPMATDGEIEQMAADIRARGLLNPIITLDGKILDGRNRERACELADVTPDYEVYRGTDPLGDVVAWNLHRRQLSTSQRAEVARTLKPMYEEQARERQRAAGGDHTAVRANLPEAVKGKAIDQAAAAVGVSGRTVQDAEYVHTHAPELSEKIKAGEMTVNAAKEEVKKREATPKWPARFKTPEDEEAWYEDQQKQKQKQHKGKGKDALAARGSVAQAIESISTIETLALPNADRPEIIAMLEKLKATVEKTIITVRKMK